MSVSHCLAEHLQLVLVPLCVVPDLSGCSASETDKGHGTFPSAESEQKMKKIVKRCKTMKSYEVIDKPGGALQAMRIVAAVRHSVGAVDLVAW